MATGAEKNTNTDQYNEQDICCGLLGAIKMKLLSFNRKCTIQKGWPG